MQELFDRRSKLEQDFMDRYLASVESYQQQLEALRIADAEDYHILKIRSGPAALRAACCVRWGW